jgi:hypothetical protein
MMSSGIAPTIEELIQTTNDPEKRTMLVVLNKMVQSLDANTHMTEANTRMTEAVSNRLEEHIEAFQKKVRDDEEVTNKGKGAWKVLAWILGVAQTLIVWGLLEARAESRELHAAINAHQTIDSQLRMELINIANNSTNADLRQANRIDLLEARCDRLDGTRSGK